MGLLTFLYDFDERARSAYDQASTARLVGGLIAIFVVVGVSVGEALGHPFYFLAAMMVAGLFPFFIVATSKRRRR